MIFQLKKLTFKKESIIVFALKILKLMRTSPTVRRLSHFRNLEQLTKIHKDTILIV